MGEIVEINATKDQIKDFLDSVLWADITRECESWVTGFQREQDAIVDDAASTNPSTASVLLHLGDINGRKKAITYLLSLPELFLQILNERTKTPSEEVSNE